MRILAITTLLIPQLFAVVCVSDEPTRFQQKWKSGEYIQQPFPSEWCTLDMPATVRNLAAYQRYKPKTLSIREVISHFGMPDRYLASAKATYSGVRWLIYDLPDGSAVGFYLPVRASEYWGTGVILDSSGRLLRSITSERPNQSMQPTAGRSGA
jgi:hypothetical protein